MEKKKKEKNEYPVCCMSYWVDEVPRERRCFTKFFVIFQLTLCHNHLYDFRHTTKEIWWQNIKWPNEEGVLHHHANGKAWKNFDIKFPDFASQLRNMHLGLTANGFNPFGNMSLFYSTQPVVLKAYNLSPWLRLKDFILF